jgi:hypothetical protein
MLAKTGRGPSRLRGEAPAADPGHRRRPDRAADAADRGALPWIGGQVREVRWERSRSFPQRARRAGGRVFDRHVFPAAVDACSFRDLSSARMLGRAPRWRTPKGPARAHVGPARGGAGPARFWGATRPRPLPATRLRGAAEPLVRSSGSVWRRQAACAPVRGSSAPSACSIAVSRSWHSR